MRLIRGLSFLAALAASCSLFGQTKNDEEAVRNLPHAFCDAWAKHDGHDLARIMAPDVDFVTVGSTWLHGQTDFEKYHSRLLSGLQGSVEYSDQDGGAFSEARPRPRTLELDN
jgi:hypothetical protein